MTLTFLVCNWNFDCSGATPLQWDHPKTLQDFQTKNYSQLAAPASTLMHSRHVQLLRPRCWQPKGPRWQQFEIQQRNGNGSPGLEARAGPPLECAGTARSATLQALRWPCWRRQRQAQSQTLHSHTHSASISLYLQALPGTPHASLPACTQPQTPAATTAMALSFPRTGGLFTDDFFSPFFGPMGFPDVTREFSRALAPSEGGQQQLALATRGMPVDVVSGLGGAISSAGGRVGIGWGGWRRRPPGRFSCFRRRCAAASSVAGRNLWSCV